MNHSYPFSAEVKNGRSFISSPSYDFMLWTGRTLPLTSTCWWWKVSSPLSLPYPRGKRRRYPLNWRLGGPQSRPRRFGEERNLFPFTWIEARFLGHPIHSLFVRYTKCTVLVRMLYKYALFWGGTRDLFQSVCVCGCARALIHTKSITGTKTYEIPRSSFSYVCYCVIRTS